MLTPFFQEYKMDHIGPVASLRRSSHLHTKVKICNISQLTWKISFYFELQYKLRLTLVCKPD